MHQEAFEDTWEPIRWSYEEWAHAYVEPSSFDPDLWLLAWSGEDPCGVAICHVHATDPTLGWIAVLGVRRAWRRRGIARALLAHAFAGFAEVVQTPTTDQEVLLDVVESLTTGRRTAIGSAILESLDAMATDFHRAWARVADKPAPVSV